MDFFKVRCRQILCGAAPEEAEEKAYEGKPLPLNVVYSSIKNLIKRPTCTYNNASAKDQPHYMKMTFSMGRQAPAGAKFMELSKQNNISKSVANLSSNLTDGQLNPLLLSLKNKGGPNADQNGQDNKFLDAVFGSQ